MNESINLTLNNLNQWSNEFVNDFMNDDLEIEPNYTYYHNMSCPSTEMVKSKYFFLLLYAVVCIIGIMGNTLVIYVVLRFSNMQTVTNMYILNLAIADECFLIGIPFLLTTMHLGSWTFGRAMCKAFMVSTSITQFTSSIFLLIMSTDRYIAICRHVSAGKYRTPFVSRVVSGIAWLTSAIFMLPIILYSNTVQTPSGHTCVIIWPEDGHLRGLSFTLYALIFGFIIPLSFIMSFYCLVIRKLRSVGRKTNKSKTKRRSHRKATKLVLTVITVYILCWLPYWISQVALISSSPAQCSTRLTITIFLMVSCLAYSNSAINPILYAYLSDNFKKCFLKACQCAGAKEVNAQLKLENSVLPKKSRNKNQKFESNQFISTTTNEHNQKLLSEPVTTTTGASCVSSRNPSPPNHRTYSVLHIHSHSTMQGELIQLS